MIGAKRIAANRNDGERRTRATANSRETRAGIDRVAQVSEWTACHKAAGAMPDGPRGSALPGTHRQRPRDRRGPQKQKRPEQRGEDQGKLEGPKRVRLQDEGGRADNQ